MSILPHTADGNIFSSKDHKEQVTESLAVSGKHLFETLLALRVIYGLPLTSSPRHPLKVHFYCNTRIKPFKNHAIKPNLFYNLYCWLYSFMIHWKTASIDINYCINGNILLTENIYKGFSSLKVLIFLLLFFELHLQLCVPSPFPWTGGISPLCTWDLQSQPFVSSLMPQKIAH